jgi:hypothetical protein
MKSIPSLLAALIATTVTALAGNIGPGPWANGAYFPGQFDGVYSASIFGSNAVSGVVGFGLQNGGPSTSTNSTVTTNAIQNTISVDPFQNYFVIFVDGTTYAGVTIANVNNDANIVTGALFNGVGPNVIRSFTNIVSGEITFQTFSQTCSGGFTAKLKSKKSIVTFKGNETGIVTTASNGTPLTTNIFSLNGLKVSNDSSSVATASTSTQ